MFCYSTCDHSIIVLMHCVLPLFRVNWVEVNGTHYKKPCVLVTEVESEYPKFAKLMDVFVVDSKKVVFQVQPLQTVEFIPHFHCYVVEHSLCQSFVYVSVQSLFTHLPHHLRVLPGSIGTLCVVPRHHFVSLCD